MRQGWSADPKDSASHVNLSGFSFKDEPIGAIGKGEVHLASPAMSWGVYDYTARSAENFPAEGGRFHSLPGHRYLVVLRVEDPFGVEQITLDGSGKFEAWTEPDSNGQIFGAPSPLPASIPHQEFNGHGRAPSLQDLIVVMKPDLGFWAYDRLSCGFHAYNRTPGSLEYFAVSGVMTFSGTSRNVIARESSATLRTIP